MNEDWVNFLKSCNAFDENTAIESENSHQALHAITALTHLSILRVTGTDASQFLQGQLCCNINELTDSKSFFTAFCNAKGRTITTLLIIKTSTGFLLILPSELIDKVSKKLKMYVMRSDVQLNNDTDKHSLIGLNCKTTDCLPALPEQIFDVSQSDEIFIKVPLHLNRYLVITPIDSTIPFLSALIEKHDFSVQNSDSWIAQDISAGIPWLTETTSEAYIPQMLNIDKLGGISYTKGCYTGQEIIARTHYLGKAKRELYLAYCENTAEINNETQIITDNQQNIGKILSLQTNKQHIKLLAVMQSTETELKNLSLNNSNQDKINIIDFQ